MVGQCAQLCRPGANDYLGDESALKGKSGAGTGLAALFRRLGSIRARLRHVLFSAIPRAARVLCRWAVTSLGLCCTLRRAFLAGVCGVYAPFGAAQCPSRYVRRSSLLDSSSPTTFSAAASSFSVLPIRQAIFPRWASEADRCPSSTSQFSRAPLRT